MGTKMFLLCVVLSFIGISQAQVFGLGKCAQVKTQDNLDLNKVLKKYLFLNSVNQKDNPSTDLE